LKLLSKKDMVVSTKIILAKKKNDRDNVFLVNSLLGEENKKSSALFKPETKFAFNAVITEATQEADVFLVPQPVMSNEKETIDYLSEVIESWKGYEKPKLLFIGGDLSHLLNIHGFYNLKGTQYKRYLKENEIIIPPFCEDFGEKQTFIPRGKSEKPSISFCGWAGFDTRFRYVKYLLRLLSVELQKLFFLDSSREVFKRGLYFRRKALRLLRRSDLVEINFIIRNSFSGHEKTISLSPEQARREYIENMTQSDFVLAPKGDANYSVRFFEALSLGRIPILIDTECCLPLEDVIDYSKCVLRVSYRDIHSLPEIVASFYNSLTDEQFKEMQREARNVFEKYLKYDSFMNFVFSNLVK
jgi:hypothetical protein